MLSAVSHRCLNALPPRAASAAHPSRRHFQSTITAAMKATWNGTVVAESDATVIVEGNNYFPPDSIKKEFFLPSQTHTTCGWKGVASYYTLSVGGQENKDAAWFYPEVLPKANNIKGYVAFWKGVKVGE